MTTSKRITVKIGEYTDRSGAQKARWKTIGELVTKDDGGQFIKLDATCLSMQLFALANRERNDSIICSMFSDNDKPPAAANIGSTANIEDDVPL